jgi:hypothetical protein
MGGLSGSNDHRQVALLIQSGPAGRTAVLVVKQEHDVDSNMWELPTLSLGAAQDENERQALEEQAEGDPALQQEGAIDALVCAKKVSRTLFELLNERFHRFFKLWTQELNRVDFGKVSALMQVLKGHIVVCWLSIYNSTDACC